MQEIRERIQKLREAMKEEGIDCYLVFSSDPHQSEYLDEHYKTRAYLSGFTGSAGYMAITSERAILWTDGRYHVQAERQLEGSGIELFKLGLPDTQTLPQFLETYLEKGMCAACDGTTISRKEYTEFLDSIRPAGFRTDVDLFEQIWDDRPNVTHKPIYELPLSVCGQMRSEKIADLRTKLKQMDADSCLISDLSSVMWLFNIRGKDVSCNPVAFSYAYVSRNEAILFAEPSAVSDVLREALRIDGITCLPYEEILSFLTNLWDMRIALDPITCNCRNYAALFTRNKMAEFNEYELIPKHVKNETEIAMAKKYHEADAVSMIRFIKYIKSACKTEKITEYRAAQYVDGLRAGTEGFTDLSFETICAYGPNGAIIHYAPEKENSLVIEPKGFLLLDSGGQYMGATTDVTRTIALGPLTDEEKTHYTAVLKAVIALAGVRFMKGTTGLHLDILARSPIWELGIDYRHGTGHGIGAFLNVHEGPQNFRFKMSNDSEPVEIVPGMITSDEPGIYIENSHGIRIENEILCVDDAENEWGTFYRFETLTLVPLEKEAIVLSMLTEKEKQWINAYHKMVYERISPYLEVAEKEWLKQATDPI